MRILFDARMAGAGPMHGIARYLVRLLEQLPALAPDLQLELMVARADLEQARQRFPGFALVPTRSRPFQPLEQLELPWLVARRRPDLVHYTSIAVAHSWGCPAVVTVHDMIPFFFQPGLAKRLYARFVLGPVARRARHVVVGSRQTLGDVTRLLRVDPSRITVCYYGVDPAGRPDSSVAARYGLTGPYLLCVSNPKPHKNVAFLLRGFRGLDLPLQLLLVSPTSPELETLCAADPRVVRAHPLPEADLQSLLAGAWALVMPSLYEGFGLPPAEAMVYGTPVLVANASSLPEVVGEAGLLFDPHDEQSLRDQLLRLHASPALRERLRQAGPEQVRQFDWREIARKHVEIYRGRISPASL